MSDVTNMTLADSVLTPVDGTPAANNHTYVAVRVSPDKVEWRETAVTPILAQPHITVSRRESAKHGTNVYNLHFRAPSMEQLSAAANGLTPGPTIAYFNEAHVKVIMSQRSTYDERQDFERLLRGVMSHAQWTALVAENDMAR